MSSKLFTDLQCDFPFLNYRRRQSIPKTKLRSAFVEKEWHSFPTSFSENFQSTSDQKVTVGTNKDEKEQLSKYELEDLRKQLLQDGCKSKKRKSPLQMENGKTEVLQHTKKIISAFTNQTIQPNVNGHKANKDSLIDVAKRHSNTVFLEVQNIQKSFIKGNSAVQFKSPILHSFAIDDSFGHQQKKKEGLENVPKRTKICDSTFISDKEEAFSSVKSVQRVKASSILAPVQCSFPVNEEAETKKILSHNRTVSVKTLNFSSCSENTFECQKIIKNTISQDVSSLIVTKTTGTNEEKGSNWVHSLPQALLSAEADDSARRRKIRNTLPGGLAEQMLKLQRREKSERVLWKHKADESKKKALANYLCLVINSVSYMADTVMVKCLCISRSNVPENAVGTSCVLSPESSLPDGELHGHVSEAATSQHVVVLFKKSTFTKLHLNARDAFYLYPPWQTLQVRSIPCPIILCAYFVEPAAQPHITYQNETMEDMKLSEDLGFSSTTVNTPKVSSMDVLFQGPVTLSARVHRVWHSEDSLEKFSIFKTANKHFRSSVLLQTEDGTFHEVMLRFGTDPIPNAWRKFFSRAEGRCYIFRNLRPSHKLHIKRHKDFFRILNSLSKQQHGQIEKELNQHSCYQLMLTCISEVPQEISEKAFPQFCPFHILPLSQLYKSEAVVHRVSCMGKVLLKCNKSLYISDESLHCSESLRYIQVQILSSSLEDMVQIGTVVLIKEALFQEEFLLLDRYSQLQPLFESSDDCTELGLRDRMNQILLLQLQNVIQPLNPSSEINHLVSIKGDVASVDENKAFTWLQCSFCLQENLIQDTNMVIYCEDCCQVVPMPVLNVKMEVTIHCQNMPLALVNVQLLSTTIRHILQIDDNTFQPQCSVGDVLGKTIGPLYCFIRNCEIIHDQQIFHLSEMPSN